MPVLAQCPSNTGVFPPDYSRKAPLFNLGGLRLDDAAVPSAANHGANLLGVAATQPLMSQRQVACGATMFSGDQSESELTCNVSGSRKRAREDNVASALNFLQQQQQQQWLAGAAGKVSQGNLPTVAGAGVSAGLQVSLDNSRLNDSAMSSTSGRTPAGALASAISLPAFNPLVQELVAQLHSQSHEIDTLIRLQNERLRSGLEEARKRHCRTLLSAMEHAVLRRLREKEAELESVSRRNAELEEKIRQIASENQIWFNVARNNEAIVSSLRASLEQFLQSNGNVSGAGAAPPAAAQGQDVEEGYGDSDCVAPGFPADDAHSCCYEGGAAADVEKNESVPKEGPRQRRVCKVCREQEVSVLLLPCRHLCLCKQCEARLDACPVCNAVKNASLQIFMS